MFKHFISLIIIFVFSQSFCTAQYQSTPLILQGNSPAQNNANNKPTHGAFLLTSFSKIGLHSDEPDNSGLARLGLFLGGVGMAIPVGTMIAGGEPNWLLFSAGAILTGVSLPFVIASSKKKKYTSNTADRRLPNTYQPQGIKIETSVEANGIGLRLAF